jgi:hypothetical protein
MLVVKCNGQGVDLSKIQKASAEGIESEVHLIEAPISRFWMWFRREKRRLGTS